MKASTKIIDIPYQYYEGRKFPAEFLNIKDDIMNFEVRDDDTFILSVPKSGTTWCQEMVWLLANNLDYEKAKTDLIKRFIFFEVDCLTKSFLKYNDINKDGKVCEMFANAPSHLNLLKQSPSPRFIYSHLPWRFLPKQIQNGEKTPKIICMMRNPKETITSDFYFTTEAVPRYQGTVEDYVDLYISGKLTYIDYFDNVLSYWEQRNLPNLLIVTYEEMHANLESVIRKVAEFLGKTYSDIHIKELVRHLSFDQMKYNIAVNRKRHVKKGTAFMRSGTTDSYKRIMTPELIRKVDKWIVENTKGTGLPYEEAS